MKEKVLELKAKITQLKANLKNTDYQAIKFAEGELSAEEYSPVREQRKAWRQEVNNLEEQLYKIVGKRK